ncbi:MAG: YggT family protein [Gammaproteobacteria bacterium]|nr:YggT family protein [Gammaproteobacteria bacterium]MDH3560252.1 YggT family protein [Gammaproteobacteria bacterium]
MQGSYFTNPLEFVISTLFSLYILAIMLRFLLGAFRADFYNPASQFLVRITNPLLVPLRKVIPSIGKFDSAALLLMLILQIISLVLVLALRGGGIPVGAVLLSSIAELVSLMINVFIFAIIIQVILSWVNPGSYNPVSSLLYSLTSPVLRPIQRLIPPISGIDLSPLVALLGLQVLRMLVLPLLA